MLDIKFRAYDKITKQIFQVRQIDFEAIERNVYGFITTKSILGDIDTSLSFRSFDNVKLMQFTGLKDKNGKEIYEGDKIGVKIGAIDFILKIEFEHGKFMAVGDDDLTAFDLFTITDKCEVIGNIYENKYFSEKK